MNHARKTSPPPFMWKVNNPPPEKNYMNENYQRMKSIAAEGQRKRFGPLKARFVPGVTKNDRYAHVQSRVGAFLKGGESLLPPQKSYSDELANRRMQQSQKFAVNGGPRNRSTPIHEEQYHHQNGNGMGYGGPSRLSRSSIDLRSQSGQSGFATNQQNQQRLPLRRQGSISASGEGFHHGGSNQSLNHSEFPSVQILQPNPPDESIYKWKFNDEDEPLQANGNRNYGSSQSLQQKQPPQHCHRVEYVPCDGICAEETIVNNSHNPDSARSNSSRTSRGCNTEETRIFPEVKMQQPQQPYHFRGMVLGNNQANEEFQLRSSHTQNFHQPPVSSSTSRAELPKPDEMYTMSNGNGNGNYPAPDRNVLQRQQDRQQVNQEKRLNEHNIYPFNRESGCVAEQMRTMNIRDKERQANNMKGRLKPASKQEVGGGGDVHAPGTVPKYLKQRQKEWRDEEAARQEAEQNSHIPNGYVLMSEEERAENLRQFRKNYEMLIAELNRIPITVDTMRVRTHKADLEKQLTRLEDAMKTFSRPKVWVKLDD